MDMLQKIPFPWNLKMLSNLINDKQVTRASSNSAIVAMLVSKYIFY